MDELSRGELDGRILDFMSRHLVGLTGRQISTGSDGRPRETFFILSGFVLSLHDVWFWVTAGHALKDVAAAIEAGGRITSTSLIDFFGPDAKYRDGDAGRIPFAMDFVRRTPRPELIRRILSSLGRN